MVSTSSGCGKQRLRSAFDALKQELQGVESARVMTVKALCEKAEISRNALYRYHGDVLKELKAHNALCARSNDFVAAARLSRLQQENASLRVSTERLAALVDYYFCALKEATQLLERRERELANVHRQLAAKVVPLQDVSRGSPPRVDRA